MTQPSMKAPFPWFGGKSKVALQVWAALGDVDNYVEPFAGSLAVLLGRPTPPKIETVNDIDRYIANFWRALQHDPQAVAHYANNPVNEADLTARHIWLVNSGAERIARIEGDPDYYDAKVAGWWVWGICSWIGGGWCSGTGAWTSVDGKLTRRENGIAGGVSKQRVHLSDAGQGVNRASLRSGVTSDGVKTGETEILAYLNELAARLRYVRVCCGDWSRVVTDGALAHGNTVGVFLDPPYDMAIGRYKVYNTDTMDATVTVSAHVRDWCIAHQDNPRYRIVLAGYEGEHDLPGWKKIEWSARRAYGNSKNSESRNALNRHRERLWLSPNCLHIQERLF